MIISRWPATDAWLALIVLLIVASIARAGDEFEPKVFHAKGHSLPYHLLVPEGYEKGRHYPLLVFFHGFGERGADNEKQLKHCVGVFLKKDIREKYKTFVIAPQAPGAWINVEDFKKPLSPAEKANEPVELTLELINALTKEYSIDTRRVYISGASNGGYAVWYLLEHHPNDFAAAVPMCGGGVPSEIHVAKNVPIWAFHGEKDPTVPIERSREMIAALKAAGGHPNFTEYPKVGHMEAAIRAYNEHEFFDWLFEQKRQ